MTMEPTPHSSRRALRSRGRRYTREVSSPEKVRRSFATTFRTRAQQFRHQLWSCFRVLAMSSVIPSVFLIRYWLRHPYDTTIHLPDDDSTDEMSNVVNGSLFHFLEQLDLTLDEEFPGDIVELSHCDLSRLDWEKYTQWATPIVHNMTQTLSSPITELQQQEFVLQLLEMYAMDVGVCDFALYTPTVPRDAAFAASTKLQSIQARLAIIVVAYHNIQQLTALVDALYLPEEVYFIIHLDSRVSDEYAEQVQQLAYTYHDVVVVQFGTVLYPTDTVSRILWQILRWITIELELTYEYVLLLDGAAYPLVSANELVEHIFQEKDNSGLHLSQHRQVWLGEITQNGAVVNVPQYDYLQRRRWLSTIEDEEPFTKRLPRSLAADVPISSPLRNAMNRKTNSGNVGIYSHHVIHKLLGNPSVLELLAYSKYGCCCCLEERNWVAALSIVGYQQQALEQGSMFQLWGGTSSDCQSSMSNAVLSLNETLCYKTEDPLEVVGGQPAYIYGSELWDELVRARRKGYLFARKFSSENVSLRNRIQEYLWDSE